MKRLCLLIPALFAAAILAAQQPASKSPVMDVVRQQLQTRAKNMVAAAEEMPDNKYDYKPTPEQMSFGELLVHVATANAGLCAALSGTAVPQLQLTPKDPKPKLVEGLRKTFEFCSTALPKVDDSSLGQEMSLRDRKMTKATGVLYLISDWADHYGGQATYLRLNGLLPPTAKKEGK